MRLRRKKINIFFLEEQGTINSQFALVPLVVQLNCKIGAFNLYAFDTISTYGLVTPL